MAISFSKYLGTIWKYIDRQTDQLPANDDGWWLELNSLAAPSFTLNAKQQQSHHQQLRLAKYTRGFLQDAWESHHFNYDKFFSNHSLLTEEINYQTRPLIIQSPSLKEFPPRPPGRIPFQSHKLLTALTTFALQAQALHQAVISSPRPVSQGISDALAAMTSQKLLSVIHNRIAQVEGHNEWKQKMQAQLDRATAFLIQAQTCVKNGYRMPQRNIWHKFTHGASQLIGAFARLITLHTPLSYWQAFYHRQVTLRLLKKQASVQGVMEIVWLFIFGLHSITLGFVFDFLPWLAAKCADAIYSLLAAAVNHVRQALAVSGMGTTIAGIVLLVLGVSTFIGGVLLIAGVTLVAIGFYSSYQEAIATPALEQLTDLGKPIESVNNITGRNMQLVAEALVEICGTQLKFAHLHWEAAAIAERLQRRPRPVDKELMQLRQRIYEIVMEVREKPIPSLRDRMVALQTVLVAPAAEIQPSPQLEVVESKAGVGPIADSSSPSPSDLPVPSPLILPIASPDAISLRQEGNSMLPPQGASSSSSPQPSPPMVPDASPFVISLQQGDSMLPPKVASASPSPSPSPSPPMGPGTSPDAISLRQEGDSMPPPQGDSSSSSPSPSLSPSPPMTPAASPSVIPLSQDMLSLPASASPSPSPSPSPPMASVAPPSASLPQVRLSPPISVSPSPSPSPSPPMGPVASMHAIELRQEDSMLPPQAASASPSPSPSPSPPMASVAPPSAQLPQGMLSPPLVSPLPSPTLSPLPSPSISPDTSPSALPLQGVSLLSPPASPLTSPMLPAASPTAFSLLQATIFSPPPASPGGESLALAPSSPASASVIDRDVAALATASEGQFKNLVEQVERYLDRSAADDSRVGEVERIALIRDLQNKLTQQLDNVAKNKSLALPVAQRCDRIITISDMISLADLELIKLRTISLPEIEHMDETALKRAYAAVQQEQQEILEYVRRGYDYAETLQASSDKMFVEEFHETVKASLVLRQKEAIFFKRLNAVRLSKQRKDLNGVRKFNESKPSGKPEKKRKKHKGQVKYSPKMFILEEQYEYNEVQWVLTNKDKLLAEHREKITRAVTVGSDIFVKQAVGQAEKQAIEQAIKQAIGEAAESTAHIENIAQFLQGHAEKASKEFADAARIGWKTLQDKNRVSEPNRGKYGHGSKNPKDLSGFSKQDLKMMVDPKALRDLADRHIKCIDNKCDFFDKPEALSVMSASWFEWGDPKRRPPNFSSQLEALIGLFREHISALEEIEGRMLLQKSGMLGFQALGDLHDKIKQAINDARERIEKGDKILTACEAIRTKKAEWDILPSSDQAGKQKLYAEIFQEWSKIPRVWQQTFALQEISEMVDKAAPKRLQDRRRRASLVASGSVAKSSTSAARSTPSSSPSQSPTRSAVVSESPAIVALRAVLESKDIPVIQEAKSPASSKNTDHDIIIETHLLRGVKAHILLPEACKDLAKLTSEDPSRGEKNSQKVSIIEEVRNNIVEFGNQEKAAIDLLAACKLTTKYQLENGELDWSKMAMDSIERLGGLLVQLDKKFTCQVKPSATTSPISLKAYGEEIARWIDLIAQADHTYLDSCCYFRQDTFMVSWNSRVYAMLNLVVKLRGVVDVIDGHLKTLDTQSLSVDGQAKQAAWQELHQVYMQQIQHIALNPIWNRAKQGGQQLEGEVIKLRIRVIADEVLARKAPPATKWHDLLKSIEIYCGISAGELRREMRKNPNNPLWQGIVQLQSQVQVSANPEHRATPGRRSSLPSATVNFWESQRRENRRRAAAALAAASPKSSPTAPAAPKRK